MHIIFLAIFSRASWAYSVRGKDPSYCHLFAKGAIRPVAIEKENTAVIVDTAPNCTAAKKKRGGKKRGGRLCHNAIHLTYILED